MLTTLRLLNLRRVVQQPLRALVVVVAVAGGVALSLGVAVAKVSVDRSFADLGEVVTGPATIRVRGPVEAGLETGAVEAIRDVDGVARAVPLVTTVVEATGTDGGGGELLVAFGVDCSVEVVLGDVGCDQAALDAAAGAGDAPLVAPSLLARLGPDATVHTDAGAVPLDGAVVLAALEQVNDGRAVVWPLPNAQRLLGRDGRLDQVLVVPEPGTGDDELGAAILSVLGDHAVVEPAESSGANFVTALVLPGLLVTSLVGLMVGLQLVHTTFAVALEERRRELAVAAAVGATPRVVTAGLLAEAAVLGLVGGVAGTAGAAVVGGAFVRSLSDQIARISGAHLDVHVPPGLVAAGAALGAGMAVVAAVRPARAAARLDLAAELSERERHVADAARPRRNLVLLLLGVAAGLALGWLGYQDGSLQPWQPVAAVAGAAIGGTCAFRLPGHLAVTGVRAVGASPLGGRPAVRVAVGNLLGDPRRTASAANALGIAASLAVTLGAVVPSLSAAGRRDSAQTNGDAVFVSTLPFNNTADIDSKLPPEAAAAVAAVPGVGAVGGVRSTSIDHPDISGIGITFDTFELGPPRYHVYRGVGPGEAFAAGRVMIGPGLARAEGLAPGDSFAVPGLRGFVELTVGGVWASPNNVGFSVTAPPATFAAVAGERPPAYLLARPAPGVSTVELAERIRAADVDPRARVFDPAQLGEAYADDLGAFVGPFVALQRAMLLVGFVATLSTLLLSAVQRRRELATLAAVGMPPADLARMTLAEAGVLGLVATVVGVASGLVAYVGFVFMSANVTGLTMAWVVPWSALPRVLVLIVAIAVAGAAWPAWRSTRVEPALALRYE